jgi:crossover junction endodeoxyribonuclease RusA
MTITLPLPPSVNSYWRSVALRTGVTKVLISREGRRWKKDAGNLLALQWRGGALPGDVAVEIDAYFRNHRRDLDNILKPCLDLLQSVALVNDRQVKDIRLRHHLDARHPRIEVRVVALSREEAA